MATSSAPIWLAAEPCRGMLRRPVSLAARVLAGLLGRSARLLPAARREWAEAVLAEMGEVPAGPARVRAFLADDDPHPLRPAGQVQHAGELRPPTRRAAPSAHCRRRGSRQRREP